MALTIYCLTFHPENHEKGRGKGTTVANGNGISRIPFRTEKVDYLWGMSAIPEKILRKPAFPFDLESKISGLFG